MPRVEVPTNNSKRDPKAVLPEDVPSEMLANEHDAHDRGSAAAAPARSVRRATARRASKRRATARSRQVDTDASIIGFLAQHPGSTAGDLAKGLNLNPASVATRLTQLAKAGEIKKASRGYSTEQATQPRSHQRPPGHSH